MPSGAGTLLRRLGVAGRGRRGTQARMPAGDCPRAAGSCCITVDLGGEVIGVAAEDVLEGGVVRFGRVGEVEMPHVVAPLAPKAPDVRLRLRVTLRRSDYSAICCRDRVIDAEECSA